MIRLQSSNPFSTRYVRPGAIDYRFDIDPVAFDAEQDSTRRLQSLVAQLADHRCGLLVGHHGSGKSTLLEAMMPLLQCTFGDVRAFQLCRNHSSSYQEWLNRRRASRAIIQQIQTSHRNGCVVIDGAEQLGAWSLRCIRKQSRKRGVVILATSHHPIKPFHVLYRTSVTAELVNQLASSLTEFSSPTIRRIVADQLLKITITNQHNVRDLFFDLYDAVQNQGEGIEGCAIRCQPRQTQSD